MGLIKKLKCELSSSSKHNSKRSKVIKNSDDGFTRFSAAAFSNVIDCLTPHQRAVTVGYGFGSLLLFSKCSVISLTKESVNLVLGLPLGPKPFPAGSSDGKTIVLSKFGKEHLPQVTFFANKIIKQAEMSDEDISVCFMVVSLSTFLCSNTSLIPSQKYFSVFEDIDNAKDYDWCGLVLCWLLDRVKVFNSVNSGVGSSKYRQCLGGCIYYLAVMYLDHIDFRQRQVKADIPRISVWKDSMIQFYSNLDKKSLGVYGHRPLLDYDSTYYAQYRVFRSAEVDVTLDEDFCKQLEEVAGCTIPHSLKVKISVLVQKHCLMSVLSINLDLTSLGNVPDDLKRLFTKILNYASNVSARTKDLVVELMKAIAETERNDSEDRVPSPSHSDPGGGSPSNPPPSSFRDPPDPPPEGPSSGKSTDVGKVFRIFLPSPQFKSADLGKGRMLYLHCTLHLLYYIFFTSLKFADVVQRSRTSPSCNLEESFDQIPLTHKDSVQKPVFDLLKFARSSHQQSKSVTINHSNSGDKNDIHIVNDYVPDSVSPLRSRHRNSYKSPQDYITMQSLCFTQDDYPCITPNLSKKTPIFASVRSSAKKDAYVVSQKNVQSSPDIQIVGSRTLAENVHDMAQKADALYNGNSNNLKSSMKTPSFSDFKGRNSSTGGKVPIRGPRRLVVPSRFLADEFITQKNKYCVSKFEIDNYKAIYYLASSSSSSENAVLFGGVRCMFWSLGEYLKSGGCVNNFVIAAFCYHLFCKPKGQPNDSKRHYFSSNISLYFSIFYDDHWFLFIVDIKDSKFVFLDSYYTENDEYHVYVKEQMIPLFVFWWNKFVCVSKTFEEYELLYPRIPRQVDSGVFVMIFLEYWESPRSLLANLFEEKDIPNIRIKIANDLVFSHKNSGNKDLVITFGHKTYGNE
uniref:Ubiquitin-like protease family profile domain-containing protein n=1 Tax=Setaria viridis TaxID=4556 RepID=A0A4U6VWA7_SETVI|nr:hypothetical protein SEVIR_2G232200v2 [Setaria viridis]